MKIELSDLRQRVDDLEQYSRINCLNISGIPDSRNGRDNTEDTDQITLNVSIKYYLLVWELNRCRRSQSIIHIVWDGDLGQGHKTLLETSLLNLRDIGIVQSVWIRNTSYNIKKVWYLRCSVSKRANRCGWSTHVGLLMETFSWKSQKHAERSASEVKMTCVILFTKHLIVLQLL
jgi:hypothetical protein